MFDATPPCNGTSATHLNSQREADTPRELQSDTGPTVLTPARAPVEGPRADDETHRPQRVAGTQTPLASDEGALQVFWTLLSGGQEWPAELHVFLGGQEILSCPVDSAADLDALVEQASNQTGRDARELQALVTQARLVAAAEDSAGSAGVLEAGSPSTGTGTDDFFQAWLRDVQPGWGPAEQGTHLDKLVTFVGLGDSTTPGYMSTLLDAVNGRFKACGYRGLTHSRLKKLVAETRKERAQLRQCLVQAEVAAAARAADGRDGGPRPRYAALSQAQLPPGEDTLGPCYGIRDRDVLERPPLTNFEIHLEEDHQVEDEVEPYMQFAGRFRAAGRDVPFVIKARDYANNETLKAAIYTTGGSDSQMNCTMDELRNATAAISPPRVRRRHTTNSGWDDAGTRYLVPAGAITASGFKEAGPDSELHVDLRECSQAVHLNLKPLSPADLPAVKYHIATELLTLHHPQVTHSLLGMAGVAVLHRFSNVRQRFAGWLVGETGEGKTLLSRLYMCLFGGYPPGDENRFVSWCWTVNAIEKAGYYYRDALFLVDDYKTGTTQQSQIVRLLQANGDGTARNRLRSDATFNAARPIRGLLLATGENVVDHEASTMARTVVVRVEPFGRKDFDRRQQCLDLCGTYSGVMAGFIGWLLATGRTGEFADRVKEYERQYYAAVRGQNNDARVSANLAVLAAAHAQFAEYLGDVWPDWADQVRWFGEEHVPGLLSRMMTAVREQRPIEIFWGTLSDLVRHGHVRLDQADDDSRGEAIGKYLPASRQLVLVSSELALAAVQKSLTDQKRPPLSLRPEEIPGLLRKEGRLRDRSGKPVAPESPGPGGGTAQLRLERGGPAKRGFIVADQELWAEPPEKPGPANQ
jgi:hypothetical protein